MEPLKQESHATPVLQTQELTAAPASAPSSPQEAFAVTKSQANARPKADAEIATEPLFALQENPRMKEHIAVDSFPQRLAKVEFAELRLSSLPIFSWF